MKLTILAATLASAAAFTVKVPDVSLTVTEMASIDIKHGRCAIRG